MSSIPKGERKASRLEAFHIMKRIRKQITLEVLNSFDLTQKRKDKHIKSMIRELPREEKENYTAMLYQVESDPWLWLFEEERKSLLVYCRNIVTAMTMADSIRIESKTSYEERRKYWTLAIGNANALLQELQYLVEVLPKDKNRISALVLDIDKVINLIKGLRAYDNKFNIY